MRVERVICRRVDRGQTPQVNGRTRMWLSCCEQRTPNRADFFSCTTLEMTSTMTWPERRSCRRHSISIRTYCSVKVDVGFNHGSHLDLRYNALICQYIQLCIPYTRSRSILACMLHKIDHAASTRNQHTERSFLTLPKMHGIREYDPLPLQPPANRYLQEAEPSSKSK
jgi:hypothetical protein